MAEGMNSVEETEKNTPWYSLESEFVISKLATDPENGLNEEEVQKRLDNYGHNSLRIVRTTSWHNILLNQFRDILIIILAIAAVISLFLGDRGDAITITAIVLLNGILGFVQEWKAEKAIESLKKMLEPKCNVIRNGRYGTIEAKNLVPGDIVTLESGDRVPADIRLFEAINLKIDESPLTGESVPVNKTTEPVAENTHLAERFSTAWSGTAVTNGKGRGIVVETGMSTELGRIAKLTQDVTRESTPLQKKLDNLGKELGIIAVGISVLITFAGWLLGKPLIEMFFTGVALAVAAVPEGLPAVVTITLALGVRNMVRKRALIRKLQASETLGSATVICTDKTGTLTKNEMTAKRLWLPSGEYEVSGVGYEPEGEFFKEGNKVNVKKTHDLMLLLESGHRCNHSAISKGEEGWYAIGEPTEASLVVLAEKAGIRSRNSSKSVSEFSFNSERKRMTVVQKSPVTGFVSYTKGAPEVILELSEYILDGISKRPIGKEDIDTISNTYRRFASDGLRTLAIAMKKIRSDVTPDEETAEKGLTFLGLVGITDPPRPEVPNAVRLAGSAGIRIIVITGDAAATAKSVARDIGIDIEETLTGKELSGIDNRELRKKLQRKLLFARTTPEDKMRIVSLLQGMGHVVGMTGDGVNDAPALKKADIGIAMGVRGTEVARNSSDMVLTDDNFASIINAVEEGRRQYDNIQKFVRYLLSSNSGEVIAISANIMLGGPLILLPVQILWMNLVTDGITALALGVEPSEQGVMERPPRDPGANLISKKGILRILLIGSYMAALTVLVFYYYLGSDSAGTYLKAQTVAFTALIIAEKINVFNFRSLEAPLHMIGYFSNYWILFAWLANVGLQICAVYVPFLQNALNTKPLGLMDWVLIFSLGLPVLIINELFKVISWKRK